MEKLYWLNAILGIALATLCVHHLFYIPIRLFAKKKHYTALKLCRYAVIISARNEASVISHLIESIKQQDYPSELVDIYVVADNCTDDTAQIARNAGAIVYERFNKLEVGKGYALKYLFELIKSEHKDVKYDGYFVFDADNLLDSRYITEMNRVFSNGYEAVTGYRNTKNYGDNWISASYGIWFLRESEFLNHPRSILGTSCAVSGTGYVISDSLLEKTENWKYHSLTEDLEFTADAVSNGVDIGYAHDAILYDEQPVTLSQSIRQRSRWLKGSLQVVSKYTVPLVKDIAKNGRFSSYDILMTFAPLMIISSVFVLFNAAMLISILSAESARLVDYLRFLLFGMMNTYACVYAMGLLPLITEWKRIKCSAPKKILFTFTYPFFVLTFIPAMVKALFGNIEWKPIHHTAAVSISELNTNTFDRTK